MEKNRLAVSFQGAHSYDIVLEHGFEGLAEELKPLELKNRRLCIVTDSTVGPLYADTLAQCLSGSFQQIEQYEFPAGEESKNLDVVRDLYRFLIEHKFDRNDMLAALGGGVTGDLTGFAAATYLRGIRFIQIPTTLLAMSDSSVGGKTGVDFEHYKNMVGAFYMPKLVYMNISVLSTLDERQYHSGFGEVIKHGLIRDASFYDWIKVHQNDLEARNLELLEQMVRRNCEIKRAIVEADPTEQGERALLNFGHTIGHAVEKLTGFQLLHGECIGAGMAAAAYLSLRRGGIKEQELHDILELCQSFSLPVSISGLTPESILEAVARDKKKDGAVIKFILLDRIGHAVIDTSVSKTEMAEAVEFLLGERTL